MRELNIPLRLLIENEISRLCVWRNPASDPKRGADLSGNIEKTMSDVGCYHYTIKTLLKRVRHFGKGSYAQRGEFNLQLLFISWKGLALQLFGTKCRNWFVLRALKCLIPRKHFHCAWGIRLTCLSGGT